MVKRVSMRPRRHFTAEFKAEVVRLCKVGDRTIAQVARDPPTSHDRASYKVAKP